MFEESSWVDAGGLRSYGPHYPENFRTAAILVDKILKGAKSADLPIEQPTTFELVLNLKTAKAIGRDVPPTLVALANRVIECARDTFPPLGGPDGGIAGGGKWV
jgi:putative ABC transport system substrate-binding protein